MGIIIRQGIKGTIVSYLGTLLGFVNMLILFPLVCTAGEIGLYRILLDAASFFVIFSLLGSNSTLIRFFPYFSNSLKSKGQFLFYILLTAGVGFVIFSGIYLFFNEEILLPFIDKSSDLISYKYYLLPLALFLLLFNVFSAYSRALLKIVAPKFLKEVLIRLFIGIAAVFFFFNLIQFNDLIGWIVGFYGIALLLLIWYIANLKQLIITPGTSIFKSPQIKEMTQFGMITFLSAGSGVIVGKIDTLMLGSMTGLSNTGIYGVAFYIGAFIQLPRRSLSDISAPLIARGYKQGDIGQVSTIYKKSSINLLIIGSFILTIIWANIDAIFSLIPHSDIFIKGKYVVLFIGLGKLFDMAMGLNHEIITNSKIYKWNMLLIPLLAITTIITNLIFIPEDNPFSSFGVYGINGAAIASLLSIFSINLLRYLLILIKLKLQPFSIHTFKALLIAGITYLVGNVIPGMDIPILEIIIKSIAMSAIFASLVLVLKPSKDISQLIMNSWNQILPETKK